MCRDSRVVLHGFMLPLNDLIGTATCKSSTTHTVATSLRFVADIQTSYVMF